MLFLEGRKGGREEGKEEERKEGKEGERGGWNKGGRERERKYPNKISNSLNVNQKLLFMSYKIL